jgi:excinuclease ABC subunit A
MDVCGLSVEKADEFFAALKLTEFEQKIAAEVIKEIRARLGFLKNVGLGYLTLDRESGTLSGGEAQRIRLATQIGAALVGVLYVLDEPSIGLHQRDNDRLLATLKGLRDLGNTVSWSSMMPTRFARRITFWISARARASTAANWWRRARCRKFSRRKNL